MGAYLYRSYESVRKLYTQADSTLGFPISQLCMCGPLEELTRTVNVQPSILLTTIACYEAAREISKNRLPEPAFLAGHSLGEYSALVVGHALGIQDALNLTRERGRLMHQASLQNPGGMLAIIGAAENEVQDLCAESGMEISNINAPGQIVISGVNADMAKAKQIAQIRGIRRIVQLNVSGPFHSRWMQPAGESLEILIRKTAFLPLDWPVISNVSATPMIEAEQIMADLVQQIIKPVQWQRSVENMIADGVNTFVETGHGQVLTGLINRINPGIPIFNLGDTEIEKQVQYLLDYVYC
jgi:[acyl-carrier-protein] S-malonyltransferase